MVAPYARPLPEAKQGVDCLVLRGDTGSAEKENS